MSQIVVNTLVYLDDLNAGVEQNILLDRVATLGVNAVEVRREFIHDFDKELPEIAATAQQKKLQLFYSVPEEVFVDGKVNPALTDYLAEAETMGIHAIKFNIGDFDDYKGNLKTDLAFLSDSTIEVNVENDQTQTSGRIEAIEKFMHEVQENDLDIGYVYDLGNFRFVGQNEQDAAEKLAQYVRYIHLKDDEMIDGQPNVVPLDEGQIDWRIILHQLPKDVPVAVEYPVKDTATLEHGIALVEQEL